MKYLTLAAGCGLLVTASLSLPKHKRAGQEDEGGAAQKVSGYSAPPRRAEARTVYPRAAAQNPKSVRTRPRGQESRQIEMDIALDGQGLPAAQIQSLSHRIPLLRQSALAKLEIMAERHNLTTAQRQELLPLLVESTPGYHPSMTIKVLGGGTWIPAPLSQSKTVDEAIHEILDPEQQKKFEEDQLEQQAWWDEIVAQLEEDFDSAHADSSLSENNSSSPLAPPDSSTPTEQTTPPNQRGGNVFDLLKQ